MDWLTANAWWIMLLLELGILAWVTRLVYMNKYYFNQSLRAKDDQIALLERTQIENVMAKIDAMKRYIKEIERDYEKKINEIVAEKKYKDKLIYELKAMLEDIEKKAKTTAFEASGYINIGGEGTVDFTNPSPISTLGKPVT